MSYIGAGCVEANNVKANGISTSMRAPSQPMRINTVEDSRVFSWALNKHPVIANLCTQLL